MPKNTPVMNSKPTLHRLGTLVSALSLLFVLWKLVIIGGELRSYLLHTKIFVHISLYAGIYGLMLFLLAIAWAQLVRSATVNVDIALMPLVRVYGVSSIAKYLPGNVFHIIGRQWLASKLTAGHAAVFIANTTEILLQLFSALLVATLVILFTNTNTLPLPGQTAISISTGILVSSLILFLPITRRAISLTIRRILHDESLRLPSVKSLFWATILSCVFFAALAVLAARCYQLIIHESGEGSLIGAAFLIAWITGYLVPGAPGGLGVREAALLGLLSVVMPQAVILSLALLTRLITTAGDLVFFSLSHAYGKVRDRT